jgi:hypothetical protein
MFGLEFGTLIKVIAFTLITSLIGIYYIADGWEMQKLILQQAGLSVALIVSMVFYRRKTLQDQKKTRQNKTKSR